MDANIIEATKIFNSYGGANWLPTNYHNGVSYTVMLNPELVNSEDIAKLRKIGFLEDREKGNFYSYLFASTYYEEECENRY